MTNRPGSLTDKVAVITGAGSGLGRAAVLRFAEEGAVVACVDLAEEVAGTTVDEIVRRGGEAIAVGADVSVAKDAERMTAAAIKAFGRVDVVSPMLASVGREPPWTSRKTSGTGWST